MDWSELSGGDWAEIVFYGLLATYVAMMIPRLFRGSFMRGLAALAFWAAVLFVVMAGYAYRDELKAVTDRVMAVMLPGTAVATGTDEVTVFRQPDGQFVVNGEVGNRPLSFILDTGASAVVLRAEDAAKLSIPVKRLVYDVGVATANGRTMAAEVELPSLKVGPLVEDAVHALVAKPGTLHENLLGMTFLNRLESFTVSNDRLVMRGR